MSETRVLSIAAAGCVADDLAKHAWSHAHGVTVGYASGSTLVLIDRAGHVEDLLEHSAEILAVDLNHFVAVATDDHYIHMYAPTVSVTAPTEEELRLDALPSSLWHHEASIIVDFVCVGLKWFRRDDVLYLVASSDTGGLTVWKILHQPLLKVDGIVWHTELHQRMHWIDVSSDGTLIAVAVESNVYIWELLHHSAEPTCLEHRHKVVSMQWHLECSDVSHIPNVLLVFTDGHDAYFWKQAPPIKCYDSEKSTLPMFCGLRLDSSVMFEEVSEYVAVTWIDNVEFKLQSHIDLQNEIMSKPRGSSMKIPFVHKDHSKRRSFHKARAIGAKTFSKGGSMTFKHYKAVSRLPSFSPLSSIRKRSPMASLRIKDARSRLIKSMSFRKDLKVDPDLSTDLSEFPLEEFVKSATLPGVDEEFEEVTIPLSRKVSRESDLFIGMNALCDTSPEMYNGKAWVAALAKNGDLHIICVENLFSINAGAARAFEYVSLKEFHPPCSEVVSMVCGSGFSNQFTWDFPPDKHIDKIVSSSIGYSPSPTLLRLSVLSKPPSSDSKSTLLRSFAARVNERSSELVWKVGGHSSPLTTIGIHPLLPYAATLSPSDGHVAVWKMDFPHIFSSLDQQATGSGMFHASDIEGKFSYIDWIPYRGRPVLACYSSNTLEFFSPAIEEDSFAGHDQTWDNVASVSLSKHEGLIGMSIEALEYRQRFVDESESVEVQRKSIILLVNPSKVCFLLMDLFALEGEVPTRSFPEIKIKNYVNEDVVSFDWKPVIPAMGSQSPDNVFMLVLGCQSGAIVRFMVTFKPEFQLEVTSSYVSQPTKSSTNGLCVCHTNCIISRDSNARITVWEVSSVFPVVYRESMVYTPAKSKDVMFTKCVLGDGLVRIAISERVLGSLKISLHFHTRKGKGTQWQRVDLDLSRFLHEFHRFSRSKKHQIDNIRFTSHGDLIVSIGHLLCFLPAHRLFLVSNSTSLIPVPLYHPGRLRELLVEGRLALVKAILKSLLEEAKSLHTSIDSRIMMPETSLNTVLNYLRVPNRPEAKAEVQFTREDGSALEEVLFSHKLPYLTPRDNLSLLAIIKLVFEIDSQSRALDCCGTRFIIAMRHQHFLVSVRAQESLRLRTSEMAWALHSSVQPTLLTMATSLVNDQYDWEYLKNLGVGYWLQSEFELKSLVENLAAREFQKRRNPMDALIFYVALGKSSVLLGLFKAGERNKQAEIMIKYLSMDFSEKSSNDAAMSLAMSSIRKQKFRGAICFLLLAGNIEHAITICARQMNDIQLALVLCRLYNRPDLVAKVLLEFMVPLAADLEDSWLMHIALYLLDRREESIKVLLQDTKGFKPDLKFFMNFLSSPAIVATKGLTHLEELKDPVILSGLHFESCQQYFRLGWSILALESMLRVDHSQNSSDPLLPHILAQLNQDVLLALLSMRTVLKLPLSPLERSKRVKSRVDYQSLAHSIPTTTISEPSVGSVEKLKSANPFGFNFTALKAESSDEDETDSESESSSEESVPVADLTPPPMVIDQYDDGSSYSLVEEIDLLQTRFEIDKPRAISSMKRFMRSHHLFLGYLEIQVCLQQRVSMFGFLKSELDSLDSLLHSCNILKLSSTKSRRLILCASLLQHWRDGIVDDPGFNSNLESLCNSPVLLGLIYLVSFIAGISMRSWKLVHKILSVEDMCFDHARDVLTFAREQALLPPAVAVWTEMYQTDHGDFRFAEVSQLVCEAPDFSGEDQIEEMADEIILLLCVERFTKFFQKNFVSGRHRFLYSDPNYDRFQCVFQAFLCWWDDTFRSFPKLVDGTLDYCKGCVKNHIRLKDVLGPLLKPSDEDLGELFKLVGADVVGKCFEDDLNRLAKESSPSPYFNPIEVFKIEGDLPTATIVNRTNPSIFAVASSQCLHEFNVESSIRFRKRNDSQSLSDLELTTWEGSLHRYNHEESVTPTPGETTYGRVYPSAHRRASLMTSYNPILTSQLPLLRYIRTIADPIYLHFAQNPVKFAYKGQTRNEYFTALRAHPYLPFYLSSNTKDLVHLWEFELPSPLWCFPKNPALEHVTRMRFNDFGNKFAATAANGKLSIWNFECQSTEPLATVTAHNKIAWDLEFLNSDSVLATAGNLTNHGSVRIFDMLAPDTQNLVMKIDTPSDKSNGTSLCYVADRHLLISGNQKGAIHGFDLRNGEVVFDIKSAHAGRVHCVEYSPSTNHLISGCVEGTVKVWDLTDSSLAEPLHVYPNVFKKQTFLYHAAAGGMMEAFGVTDINISETGFFCSGSDGSVKFFKTK